MSAPTSAHDLDEIASMLRHIRECAAHLDAHIAEVVAAIERAEHAHSSGEAGAQGAEVMSLSEGALVIGRSKSWLHEQVRRGVIPAVRIGSRWWLRRADLIASGWLGEGR